MIDFRYHLVSIVSIFLALAVGIVLGAGPLQSGIGTTLNEQVTALRAEKEELRASLDASEELLAAEQEYSTAASPFVLPDQLAGRSAVIVALPSSDGDVVESTRGALVTGGASVTDVVTLTDDWFDPALQEERAAAAQAAATALGLDSDATGDALLRQVLAKLVSSKEPATSSTSRTVALELLTDADLVDASVTELVPAGLVVLVSGAFSGTEEDVLARSGSVRSLAMALHSSAQAMVVARDVPVQAESKQASSDAVAAVREDRDTSEVISTVDHAGQGMGPAVVVLAMAAQLGGEVGHYGTADGATAVIPPVTRPTPPLTLPTAPLPTSTGSTSPPSAPTTTTAPTSTVAP